MLHFMTICINVIMENLLQASIFVIEYMIVVLIMLVMGKTVHVPHGKNHISGNANLSFLLKIFTYFLFSSVLIKIVDVLLFQNLQTQ